MANFNSKLNMSKEIKAAMDDRLLQFSHNLVPAENDLEDAKAVANKIFRILQQNNRSYRIDRLGIMGSMEKKTALAHEFDLDCVVFINGITIQDFPKVFEVFEQTLELDESINGVVFKRPKTKGVALQATVDGFDFDIVPAINFSQDNAVQRQTSWDELSKLKNPNRDGYRLSGGLIHSQVEFIKSQNAFTHDLIRLAKFWNRSIFIEKYVSGRSTMIELIAVYAANKIERQCNDKSLVRGFNLFLEMMRDLKKVKITFNMFYPQSQVENHVLKQRPLVLDPSNPYNNFAHDLCRKGAVRVQFEKFADVTIQRLNDGYGLINLFKLQPQFTVVRRRHAEWLVGVDDNYDKSKRIKVVERNVEGNHEAVRVYRHYICFNVKFLESGGKSMEELQKQVENGIDEMEGYKREWVTADDDHEDYDVTFEIPSGDYVIYCSCNM